ncbi:MAG: hypothetical protein A3C90_01280 [Candidatus Magasanikbacteria bacterium RIFCSPHIGHO2_02_FULL_51_14]|uniref:Sugar 3,4-ketoisomerase QdtA cupin domain-containing protein n=1 Tax=Candidatus Magasanikbacteria bacterium RIFCSPHIGHO2_02_FULL_51_14 TaxID=1798683 RepID=A0A1F6MQP5_9BACT|nr:MAG: hypothetical protein A3C90_01280 [Candidatus Magasanikbacteria bacterium RIFCSPHIGHO2_02_FULL_51_14]
MAENEANSFIQVFRFVDDTSKPGRVLSTAKIGDVYMTRLTLEPGVTSGNYYHKQTRVMFYSSGSPVLAAFEHVRTKERKEILLQPRELAIHWPEYVAIATKNVGSEPAVLVFFSNNPLRLPEDTFEYRVL